MPWSIDARVPVRLSDLDDAGPDDALLIEGSVAPHGRAAECFTAVPDPDHKPGCACCLPRSSAALALDRLFRRRARGEIGFFRRVLAVTTTPEGDLAVWSALQTDPVAAARFKLVAEDGRAATPTPWQPS